jgi:predicted site-specific integrase-resolvase
MLTSQEAVNRIQNSGMEACPLTIRRWIKEGKLVAVRQGGDWLIHEGILARLINNKLKEEIALLEQKCEALLIEKIKLQEQIESQVHQQNSKNRGQPVKLDLKDDMPF